VNINIKENENNGEKIINEDEENKENKENIENNDKKEDITTIIKDTCKEKDKSKDKDKNNGTFVPQKKSKVKEVELTEEGNLTEE